MLRISTFSSLFHYFQYEKKKKKEKRLLLLCTEVRHGWEFLSVDATQKAEIIDTDAQPLISRRILLCFGVAAAAAAAAVRHNLSRLLPAAQCAPHASPVSGHNSWMPAHR